MVVLGVAFGRGQALGQDAAAVEHQLEGPLQRSEFASRPSSPAQADATTAECIIAKNRHGEVGSVQLGWDGAHTRFMNVEFTHNDGY